MLTIPTWNRVGLGPRLTPTSGRHVPPPNLLFLSQVLKLAPGAAQTLTRLEGGGSGHRDAQAVRGSKLALR